MLPKIFRIRLFLITCLILLICNCSSDIPPQNNSQLSIEEIYRIKEKVVPFFKPMKIELGDWLESFPENGQTFEQYLNSNPTQPTAERKTIYIQPMGEFTETQKKVLQLTADYMAVFFNLSVKLNEIKPLGNIPKEFQRKSPNDKQIQLRTGYFIEKLLPELLPNDAAAFICFTNYDLFPDESMNFVFGQASLQNRVGVWSLARLGMPEYSKVDYDRFLQRTLKIAMHETGHMFSMFHCTKYECLMSGSNHLGETDRRPLDVCPECMAKISWTMKYPPKERYKNLSKFWKEQGFDKLSKEFDEKLKAVLAE
jgi:archaemetzincin